MCNRSSGSGCTRKYSTYFKNVNLHPLGSDRHYEKYEEQDAELQLECFHCLLVMLVRTVIFEQLVVIFVVIFVTVTLVTLLSARFALQTSLGNFEFCEEKERDECHDRPRQVKHQIDRAF